MSYTAWTGDCLTVCPLGGCCHPGVQSGERGQLPSYLQSLREAVSAPGHQGDTAHPCRNSRLAIAALDTFDTVLFVSV